ncbi:sodium-dependent transporter [Gammaproteobacteria bacterium 45_16_T64]|nr:sodium-dependent transporter [Gammaproteobacteria bacterium 45_16_T64]
MTEKKSIHGVWLGRWTFILAATGSAVGLGNIWKFPYMAGENGGGAFVLVYLLFIAAIGIPVMLAEVMLGRRGRKSPINTMKELAKSSDASKLWGGIGWMGALSGFLILSFYSVIAGWAVAYAVKIIGGSLLDQPDIPAQFGALVSDPVSTVLWHSLFMLMVMFVVARGIHKGLETSVNILMPVLFVMLLGLLGYAATTGGLGQAFTFMFKFNPEALTAEAIRSALGHSFFTLSLGMGAIMAYGAYMPQNESLGKTVVTIGILDTLVAIVAGLVIFSIVFANGLETAAGPSLMFKTLPLAFSQMPGGVVLGGVFFILVTFAAWTSAISLAEPAVAWMVETAGFSRVKAALAIGIPVWALGLVCALSQNILSDVTILGSSVLDFLDKLTTNIMLPLGGMLIAIFTGWVMRRSHVVKELNVKNFALFNMWIIVIRFVAPAGIAYVMGYLIYEWATKG